MAKFSVSLPAFLKDRTDLLHGMIEVDSASYDECFCAYHNSRFIECSVCLLGSSYQVKREEEASWKIREHASLQPDMTCRYHADVDSTIVSSQECYYCSWNGYENSMNDYYDVFGDHYMHNDWVIETDETDHYLASLQDEQSVDRDDTPVKPTGRSSRFCAKRGRYVCNRQDRSDDDYSYWGRKFDRERKLRRVTRLSYRDFLDQLNSVLS